MNSGFVTKNRGSGSDEDFEVPVPNFEVSAVSERLREAVRGAGGNRLVAAKAGIPLGTLNGHIAGREMKLSTAAAVADACGVNLTWLAGGIQQMNGSPPPAKPPSDLDALKPDRLRRSIEAAIEAFAAGEAVPDPHNLARVVLIYYAAYTREDESAPGPR